MALRAAKPHMNTHLHLISNLIIFFNSFPRFKYIYPMTLLGVKFPLIVIKSEYDHYSFQS